MGNSISVGDLANYLAKELAGYTQEKADQVKDIVDEVSAELLANTRADARKHTGKYRRAMAIKTAYESDYEKRNVWYVKSPHHRLAHLLEKGHANRGGGRTKAYPHIEKNEQKAVKDFEERVEKVFKNG